MATVTAAPVSGSCEGWSGRDDLCRCSHQLRPTAAALFGVTVIFMRSVARCSLHCRASGSTLGLRNSML